MKPIKTVTTINTDPYSKAEDLARELSYSAYYPSHLLKNTLIIVSHGEASNYWESGFGYGKEQTFYIPSWAKPESWQNALTKQSDITSFYIPTTKTFLYKTTQSGVILMDPEVFLEIIKQDYGIFVIETLINDSELYIPLPIKGLPALKKYIKINCDPNVAYSEGTTANVKSSWYDAKPYYDPKETYEAHVDSLLSKNCEKYVDNAIIDKVIKDSALLKLSTEGSKPPMPPMCPTPLETSKWWVSNAASVDYNTAPNIQSIPVKDVKIDFGSLYGKSNAKVWFSNLLEAAKAIQPTKKIELEPPDEENAQSSLC